jgi:hypothetical protein
MKHVSNSREFVRLAYRGEMPTRMLSIWYRRDMAGHPLIKEFCQKFVRCVSELRGNVDSDTTALRPENRKKNNLKRYRRRT